MISVSEMNQLPVATRIAIHRKANVWQWPEELGEKPEGWDDLPNYRPQGVTTKETIIRPYCRAIDRRIPQSRIYPENFGEGYEVFRLVCTIVSSIVGALLGVLITFTLIS